MKTAKLLILAGCLVICNFVLSGCAVYEAKQFYLTPEGPPSDEEIAASYFVTDLKKSSAADVLPLIHMPEHALLSQSTKVLASQGEKKKGHKLWLSMFAFDENDLLAKRKYLFIVDEKRKILFQEPRTGLRLDSQLMIESHVLEEPYGSENARRIAILKYVREKTSEDIREVSEDSRNIGICGAMINQALQRVLVELKSSPAKAARLSDEKGMEFSHINLGKGKIHMTVQDDIATIKLRLGSLVNKIDKGDKLEPKIETAIKSQ